MWVPLLQLCYAGLHRTPRGFEHDPCGPWALPGERTFLTSSGVQRTSPPFYTRAEQWVQCCSVNPLKPCNQVGWANGSGWPCSSRGTAQVTPIGPFPPQPLCGSVVSTVNAGQPWCHTRQEAGRRQAGSTSCTAGTEEATIEGLREASSIYSSPRLRLPQG